MLDEFLDGDGVGVVSSVAMASSFSPISCSSNVSGLINSSMVMKQSVSSIEIVGISTQCVGVIVGISTSTS